MGFLRGPPGRRGHRVKEEGVREKEETQKQNKNRRGREVWKKEQEKKQ